MKKLIELFFTFAKIGLFTFGGGYAMLSLIEYTCVERKKWISHDEMMNITVIAESTPGPIAINAATFVGYQQARWPGSLAATCGVILPSFVILLLISLVFDDFLEIAWIAHAFQGIKIAVGLLILDAGIRMFRKMHKTVFSCIILLCAFAVMMGISVFAWNFSSVILVLLGAVAGLVYGAIKGQAPQKGGDGE